MSSRWGPSKRTKADRERDLLLFVQSARRDVLERTTAEELAGRYGCDAQFAKYHLQLRLSRESAL